MELSVGFGGDCSDEEKNVVKKDTAAEKLQHTLMMNDPIFSKDLVWKAKGQQQENPGRREAAFSRDSAAKHSHLTTR